MADKKIIDGGKDISFEEYLHRKSKKPKSNKELAKTKRKIKE